MPIAVSDSNNLKSTQGTKKEQSLINDGLSKRQNIAQLLKDTKEYFFVLPWRDGYSLLSDKTDCKVMCMVRSHLHVKKCGIYLCAEKCPEFYTAKHYHY